MLFNDGWTTKGSKAENDAGVNMPELTFVYATIACQLSWEANNGLGSDNPTIFIKSGLVTKVECEYRACRKNFAKDDKLTFSKCLEKDVTGISVVTSPFDKLSALSCFLEMTKSMAMPVKDFRAEENVYVTRDMETVIWLRSRLRGDTTINRDHLAAVSKKIAMLMEEETVRVVQKTRDDLRLHIHQEGLGGGVVAGLWKEGPIKGKYFEHCCL